MSQRLAVALAVLIAAPLAAQTASRLAPEGAPSVASVAPDGEPGVPLRVEGVVRGADGQPVAGASLYVYQTDARGYYHPDDAMGNRDPRLFALLRSDAAGATLTTVRPGPYPRGGVQLHIHYEVRALPATPTASFGWSSTTTRWSAMDPQPGGARPAASSRSVRCSRIQAAARDGSRLIQLSR